MIILLDKRLRVDMVILRETMQKEEIRELKWLSSDKQMVYQKRLFYKKSFASSRMQLIIKK